jgi:hypothetical protein
MKKGLRLPNPGWIGNHRPVPHHLNLFNRFLVEIGMNTQR